MEQSSRISRLIPITGIFLRTDGSPMAATPSRRFRPIRLLAPALVCAGALFAAPAGAELLSEDELAEVTRRPALGLYKGYAEFKMAHYAEARQIWTALTEKGLGEAWFNLAILAEDGLGEPQDAAEARRRYEKGAAAGSRNAALRLGILLQTDKLGAVDLDGARHWLRQAAEQGDAEAASQLAALEQAPAAPASTDDARLAEARRLEAGGKLTEAAAAYRAAAAAGDPRGLTRLAWLHEAGRGLPRDLGEAARLFRQAAEAGEPEAQHALAVMLETGAGQARDPDEALRWLKASAQAGYPPAVDALKGR